MRSFTALARKGTNALVLVLLTLLTVAFSVGSYRWAFKVNRTKPLAINPVMYPTFTYVNTSRFCCTKEPYYHLWRTYDWRADAYAGNRQAGEYLRVPVVYVHGNGGSYFCARSLARFLYEANVRQRRLSLRHFDERVKRVVYQSIQQNRSLAPLQVGDRVPEWLMQSAEEHVLRAYTPMLATEMFSVDYLEESFTQSAVLMIKEARFLNHTMYLLMNHFVATYQRALDAPPATAATAAASSSSSSYKDAPYPVGMVENEYIASCCHHKSISAEPYICRKAQAHLNRYSSLARIQVEVRRVQEKGMWVWAESLGGAVSVIAALMNPSLYAGIVFVGSPTHYPPLFFDVGSAWMYKVISDATLRHYPQTPRLFSHSPVDWEAEVLPHDTPLRLLDKMKVLSSETVAARMTNITLLAVNGGALDDIVPSISGYLHRSTARRPAFYTTENRLKLRKADATYGAFHRDVSTETLRGVGQAMDHRGLVYGLQFLNHSADSLVLAALLPHAAEHFAAEEFLPDTMRDRLFPTVVETLPPKRYRQQTEEWLFAHSIELVNDADADSGSRLGARGDLEPPPRGEAPAGEAAAATDAADAAPVAARTEEELVAAAEGEPAEGGRGSAQTQRAAYQRLWTDDEVVAKQFREVCVDNDGKDPIDLDTLVTQEEDDAYLFDSNSGRPLHLILGFTTYTPEEVYLPRLKLYEDAARTVAIPVADGPDNGDGDDVPNAEVYVRPATKLHLPFMRKDARKIVHGRVLSTLVSFQATRRATQPEERAVGAQRPRLAYPRFCFYVKKPISSRAAAKQKSFLQHDLIDPTSLLARSQPVYLGSHYIGNRMAMELHPGYALITGLDITTQETRLQVDFGRSSTVFPFVMAGNLRSLYIAARGNSRIPADDPEEQIQYFFGPFHSDSFQANYSWKPFSTFDGDLNDTYLVYVLGDANEQRPTLRFLDFEATIKATGDTPFLGAAALRWWVDQWPERWLSFFSAFSVIGKLGGAYVLLFFSFFVLCGEAEKWFLRDQAVRVRWAAPLTRRVFYACPLLAVLLLTVVEEWLTGTWASHTLKVCLERDPPPLLSNAEMTARMDWVERLTLLVLFAMKPNYRDCHYSWLRMQSVPVWSSFVEHIASVYFGFILTTAMLVVLLGYIGVIILVAHVVHFLCQTRRICRFRRLTKALLLVCWSMPTVSWVVFPNIPLSYRHFAAVTMMLLMLPLIPWRTEPGYCFPLYMLMVGIACIFPAHFDGQALTIRNHVMLYRTPVAFWDRERNTNITYYQALVWTIVQGSLGVVYMTLYFVAMHEHKLRRAKVGRLTDTDDTNHSTRATLPERARSQPAKEAVDRYTLGDHGRRHPLLPKVARLSEKLLLVLSAWFTVVVLRRPMEGGVVLVGNMILLLLLLTKLVELW